MPSTPARAFFQLLLVSGINVVLIITAQRRFVSSKALRALLVFLTACTYLMEASSAMRMMLYVNAYGLTYLRLLVLWFLSLLALILGAAVYHGVPRGFPAVPLYAHCVHGALARVCLRAAGRDRGAV